MENSSTLTPTKSATAGNAQANEITPQTYRFFQDFIVRESGIVLDENKHYLLEARLMPIALKAKAFTLNDLCTLLRTRSDPTLKQQVIDAMTTNETFFFRETAQYDALRAEVLPQFIQQRQITRQLSIWSAAASTGQEAYSLAMLLLEMGLGHWDIRILGTDLSTQVLDRARSGKYLQIEVNRGLPAPMLVKYFTRSGLEWQLKDEVRRMVTFDRIDLRQGPPQAAAFDLVFCRNVLIYFDVDTKRQILAHIRRALRPGGYLLLGGSETTLNLDGQFELRSFGKATFYQTRDKDIYAS